MNEEEGGIYEAMKLYEETFREFGETKNMTRPHYYAILALWCPHTAHSRSPGRRSGHGSSVDEARHAAAERPCMTTQHEARQTYAQATRPSTRRNGGSARPDSDTTEQYAPGGRYQATAGGETDLQGFGATKGL